jgi:succinate dehydrogenase/fumarate reductase flavoprotein subunit
MYPPAGLQTHIRRQTKNAVKGYWQTGIALPRPSLILLVLKIPRGGNVVTESTANLKRRGILTGIGAGGASLAAATAAHAVLPTGIRTEKHDVIVIGFGTAGLVAALQARQDGADVLVLEKTPAANSGGDSRMSGGIFFVPGKDTPDLRQAFVDDNNRVTQGRGNAELFRVIADAAWTDIGWLKQLGCEFIDYEPARLGSGGTMTLAPAPWRGMPRFLETMQKQFTDLGGKVLFEAKAKQLILDNRGRVTGVKVATADGVVDHMANAVIIAAGSYCANKYMLEQLVHPDAGAMLLRGAPTATGDGHLMALEAGAGLQNMAGLKTVSVVAVHPREPSGGNPERALRYCLAINQDGKRYVDESKGLLINGRAALTQPGQVVALVFDESIRKEHDTQMSLDVFRTRNLPVIEANSVEELATRIKVPPAQLAATIRDFNKSVRNGKAEAASPPKAAMAYRVEKPRYYAFYPLVPAITQTFGAITTNARAQVLEPDGRIIAGLYAAGNCAGPLYYDNYWPGGMQIACLVMGRIAGRLAARERS